MVGGGARHDLAIDDESWVRRTMYAVTLGQLDAAAGGL
jgi:hypothetical protein